MKIEISKAKADYEIVLLAKAEIKKAADYKDFAFYDYKGEGVLNLVEKRRIYSGLKDKSINAFRDALANALRAIAKLNIKSAKLAYEAKNEKELFHIAESAFLSLYEFDKYKSEKKPRKLEKLMLLEHSHIENSSAILKEAEILANAVTFVRDIVNEIPAIYTPERMANDAKELAKNNPALKCEILGQKELEKEKMNAMLAVAKASPHEPKLIHLSYTPKNPKAKICFVGKGVTYDTGGLSLKPSEYMLSMKADKSGAAAAMGIIKAASELGIPVEIHSVLGCVENAIGSKAYKPDDVLIAKNGVSIEVRNTDAEGRLVLADALFWAQEKIKPEKIIDLATLTGACVVGLGEYTSGVMGHNHELQSEFYKAAKESGEFFTILEFNEFLGDLIKSDVADIANAANTRYGGALTAGFFLDKFIKDEYKDSWLHLDIAGPAFVSKAWGVNPAGASGAGVRACVYYLWELGAKAKTTKKGAK